MRQDLVVDLDQLERIPRGQLQMSPPQPPLAWPSYSAFSPAMTFSSTFQNSPSSPGLKGTVGEIGAGNNGFDVLVRLGL